MDKGIIVIGYQGIGKSTLAKEGTGYIDLESSNFWINGKRYDDWYIPYCNIALHLAEQGHVVFTSSHDVVRNYLASKDTDIKIAVCYPSHDVKNAWIKKLEDRYNQTNLEKDYKAWKNAEDRYDENIDEIMNSGFYRIIITDVSYDLEHIIETFSCIMNYPNTCLEIENAGYIQDDYIIAKPITKGE